MDFESVIEPFFDMMSGDDDDETFFVVGGRERVGRFFGFWDDPGHDGLRRDPLHRLVVRLPVANRTAALEDIVNRDHRNTIGGGGHRVYH